MHRYRLSATRSTIYTTVNPWAIRVLAEVGIDISSASSKTVEDLPGDFTKSLDLVITACAEEVCPIIIAPAKRLHWPLRDPAGQPGSDAEQLERFREVRDTVRERLLDLSDEL